MALLAITYPNFVNGTPADATQVNTNNVQILAWANGGVEANNVGPGGFFATQIKPTSDALGIFGGLFGYTFAPGVATEVPLTLAGVGGQSVDYFRITATLGGSKLLWLDKTGALNSNPPFSYLRNKFINGSFAIDQRNAGASVTPTDGQYPVDRLVAGLTQAAKFSVQQITAAPPPGFASFLRITSLSNYTPLLITDTFRISQGIEANNVTEIQYGSATPIPLTLSFMARTSLAGSNNFSVAIRNAINGATRSYPLIYNIPAPNQWFQIALTIPGDTVAGWTLAGVGTGLCVAFSLGAGSNFTGTSGTWAAANLTGASGAVNLVSTNAATLDLTGVQIETGSIATPFEQRPFGLELALCQRYFATTYSGVAVGSNSNVGIIGTRAVAGTGTVTPVVPFTFPVTMRTSPTVTIISPATGASANVRDFSTASDQAAGAINTGIFASGCLVSGAMTINDNWGFHYTASAEL
jgi:hypothetical protein